MAALLAFFGGVVGLHRFYLRQNGRGVLMILLTVFTLGIISSLIGIFDSIAFLMMSDDRFDFKYNNSDIVHRRPPRYRSYDRRYQTGDYAGNGQSSPYRKDRRISKTDYQGTKKQKSRGSKKSRTPVKKQSPTSSRKQRKNNEKLINSLKESGIEKFKEYDIEDSIRDFKKILEIDPYHIAAHFNLACAYSQLEKPDKTMYHISSAVRAGFDDFNRIKTHEKLAYARIQPKWEEFVKNGFIFDLLDRSTEKEEVTDPSPSEPAQNDPAEPNEKTNDPSSDLLVHLKNLKEQREKGIITEVEFEIERRKLMSS